MDKNNLLCKGQRVDSKEIVEGYFCEGGPVNDRRCYIIPTYASAFYGIEIIPESLELVHQVRSADKLVGDISLEINNNSFEDLCCEECGDEFFENYLKIPEENLSTEFKETLKRNAFCSEECICCKLGVEAVSAIECDEEEKEDNDV